MSMTPRRFGFIKDPAHLQPAPFAGVRLAMHRMGATQDGTEPDIMLPVPFGAFDQGPINSCVLNALIAAAMIRASIIGKPFPIPSRLFGYWGSRSRHDAQTVDEGTFISAAEGFITDEGLPLEGTDEAAGEWPYDPARVNEKPKLEAFIRANDNKAILHCYRIGADLSFDERKADVRIALAAKCPIVGGFPVGRPFVDCNKYEGSHSLWHAPKDIIGRHAMVIIGVRTFASVTGHKLLSSWGPDWADEGQAWAADSPLEAGEDLTVVTDVEVAL